MADATSAAADDAAFRHEVRGWLANHVEAGWRDRYRELAQLVAYLRSWDAALFDAGYAGLAWPVKHGGGGASPARAAVFYEECARADAPDGLARIGLQMVGPAIMACGTPEQQDRHLPPMLAAEAIWSQGFSEPEAGSDLASLRSRATRVDGGWRLDGQKIWTTFAQFADWCFVLARATSPGGVDGISMFLVPLDAPGVTIRPLTTITGTNEFNAVTFDGLELPADALLGPAGEGWPIIRSLLTRERSGYNSYRLLRHTRRSVQRFRQTRSNVDGGDLEVLARLYAGALAGHQLVVDLLEDESHASPTPALGSLIKLYVTEGIRAHGAGEVRVLDDREQLDLDGHWTFDVLDSMHYTISAGTSEIQRNIVASSMLRLPSSRTAREDSDGHRRPTSEPKPVTAGPEADDAISVGFGQTLDALVWDHDALVRDAEPVTSDTMEAVLRSVAAGGWLNIGDCDTDAALAARCAWHTGNRAVPLPVPLLELWLARFAITACGADLPALPAVLAVTDVVTAAATTDPAAERGTSVTAGNAALAVGPVAWTGQTAAVALTITEDDCEGACVLIAPAAGAAPGGAHLDPTHPTGLLTLPVDRWEHVGTLDHVQLQLLHHRAIALSAAELLGIAQQLFEQALAYLRDRRQFGVPIGSFQVLKHRAVDLQAELLAANALLRLATEPWPDPVDAVAAGTLAFASAAEIALRVAGEAVQLHGGYGFTWEAGLHLGFRRIAIRASAGGGSAAAWTRAGRWVRDRPDLLWPMAAL